jgi:hypothetical protein
VEVSKQYSNQAWKSICNINILCQVWGASYFNLEAHNSILTWFHEIFNPLNGFKMDYYNIIDILYILIKECHFSEIGLLDTLAFYEVLSILDKFTKEVEERNKQQEEDNKKMEMQMADMRRTMNTNMNNNNNQFKMPSMPSFK